MNGLKTVGIGALALMALGACAQVPDEPSVQLSVRSPVFSGAEAMAIESDLIVTGTVTQVSPGRVAGEGREQIQYRDVSISIDKVLMARSGTEPSLAIVQEIGWVNDKPAQDPAIPWSAVGQRGYFFLQNDVPGKYGYLGPQARVLLDAGKIVSAGDHELQAVRHTNSLTPEQFAVEVEEAITKVTASGIANPEGPAVGDGDAK